MNDLIPVKVECHSGYKADEFPKYFYFDNIRFKITEISDRWYEGGLNPDFPVANYLKVITNDKKIYILKHEISTGNWYLLIKEESIIL
ncbi:MAG: cytoplasmic protein [Prolixibacteraceae bacterium]|nr:cytoplasmic protein [Prolixibacteraceae bacterium]MBN2775170.1 cytoplasmic protein [Prolixibacteraceae bacterium]